MDSIFIPVYEGSDLLAKLLETLTNDAYEKKEIIVIVDKPNAKSLEVMEKYQGQSDFHP